MNSRRDYWETRIGPHASFRTRDVARICQVDASTVRRWIRAGKLMALGTGEDRRESFNARIPRDVLLEFLVRRTPPPLHLPTTTTSSDPAR